MPFEIRCSRRHTTLNCSGPSTELVCWSRGHPRIGWRTALGLVRERRLPGTSSIDDQVGEHGPEQKGVAGQVRANMSDAGSFGEKLHRVSSASTTRRAADGLAHDVLENLQVALSDRREDELFITLGGLGF